ncbi:MAG: Planctomycete cytochrome, partial [Planctomycetaceae bacterium]|nr:Planctomycete cytochrome [Planctomycetaceae bacterium]
GQQGAFDKADKVSFGAWIFPTSASPSTVLSKMDDVQANRGYDLIIEGGKPAVHMIHHWPDNALKVIAKQAMSLNAWHHVLVTWNGGGPASGVKIYVDGEVQALDLTTDQLKDSIKTEQPLRIGQRSTTAAFQGMIDDIRFFQGELTADDAKRLADGKSLSTLADVFAIPAANRNDQQREQLRNYYQEVVDPDSRRWRAEIADLIQRQQKLEAAIPKTMVMAELVQPRATHLLVRGQYDAPGDKVSSGVPAFLGAMPADSPPNRLGLAQWLTSPEHPLTARVAVNHWWAGIFGTGLVETVEDFGTQGSFPSHPELLDYLATQLVAQGWDVRAVMKEIVMSATYRQSSDATPQQMALDSQNRLLGRGSRYRFSAETLRDSALAVSGLLRESLGGPSVKPYQPAGLWEEVSVERRFKYVPDLGDGAYRRSMYTFWKRTCPPPSMSTLDAPDRETCLVRRARTNTPLQALVLLNDPTYVEAARQLAVRIIQEGGSTAEGRLALACRTSLSRGPTPAEQSLLLDLLNAATTRFAKQPTAADQLLKVGNAPQAKDIPASELAAWTTLCSLLLNLDEALTRH